MQVLVEGQTERIKYQLKADGVIQDLTGMQVELVALRNNLTVLTFAGTSGIDTDVQGIVYFDPNASDLRASQSPLYIRWKVTDTSNKIAFFPNGDPEKWEIQKA